MFFWSLNIYLVSGVLSFKTNNTTMEGDPSQEEKKKREEEEDPDRI